MGALIVVFGGLAGLVLAVIAWLSGANMYWVLASYALGGHAVTGWLLIRHHRHGTETERDQERRVELEMAALREHRDQETVRHLHDKDKAPPLFRRLRPR